MQQVTLSITVTREKNPNGSYDVYCSATIPEDCPPSLLRILATWDASRTYADVIRRAAEQQLTTKGATGE